MAGEFALGGLVEGGRRLASAAPADAGAIFLTPRRAERLARRLAKMRGAAMKLGQLLSLEGEDLLPPEFSRALAVLQATADTMPATQVRRVLGREWGRGWRERLREFDFEPLAAASIGQVHAALDPDGRPLAIKVQYPGVARSIDSDVDNLAALLRVANVLPVELDLSGIVAEAKRQLRQEADYLREAEHQRRYRALVHDEPGVCVPRVRDDLTTRRVLAMERAFGRPIDDLRGSEHPQPRRDEVGRRLQRLMFRELFEFRFVQTDPNFANYLYDAASDRIALLDFGAARELAAGFIDPYRRICRAMIDRDAALARSVATEIGYLSGSESEERARALAELILLVGEPLRARGAYDYGRSDLAARARAAGFDLVFRRGFVRAPPPATIFLHRKLGGTFLLCARIRARVDTRALVEPYLP
jgi:predicted unusual protein kinase regulating ubiquinone biosynthesis (AarF/ABC1/UbiB family)